MANVLTNLAADIYVAADRVSREQVGFIPSVTINGDGSERAAVGDTIRSHVAPDATAQDGTSSMVQDDTGGQTITNLTATITKDREVPIIWNGEEIKHVNNGSGFNTIYGDQIAQAMRTLCNEMESDLATELYTNSSRAYGTAGTTPFATSGDYTDASETLRILKDNGAPWMDNASLVLSSGAGAKLLGKQADTNRQGSDAMLRQGVLLDHSGLALRESYYAPSHTKGTGSAYTTNTAGYAVGATSITLITGSGTVLAGDTVTFAGDTNKYIVATGVAAPGTIVLAAPGLKVAIPASATAMTIGNSYTGNIAFVRSAAELIVRPPAMPEGGDDAIDSMMVVDPRSGIPFELRVYNGKRTRKMFVAAVWGVKAWKQAHIATLLG